jgi:predicted Rossmann-fold nucleotide-binding protein
MKSVCVFCGSSPGNDPVHAEGARAMGTEIARRGLTLVYGGGAVGLMGIVADAAGPAREGGRP